MMRRRGLTTLFLYTLLSCSRNIQAHPPRLAATRAHEGLKTTRQTTAFCLCFGVNGGLCGSLGPSIFAFKSNTGLGNAAIGRAMALNRLAKLAGVFVWTAYARRLRAGMPTTLVLAAATAVAAACATSVYCMRSSGNALQLALILAGFCYGVTDTGVSQLTLWTHQNPRHQRTHVALLNAAYTVGCALTPALSAASLRLGIPAPRLEPGTCTLALPSCALLSLIKSCVRTPRGQGGSAYPCFIALAALSALTACALASTPFAGTVPPATTEVPAPACKVPARACKGRAPTSKRRAPASNRRSAAVSDAARARVMVGAMATVLFCVTGCEHGVGTWLPTLGARVGGIEPATMAAMASAYWSTIMIGRLGWAALSTLLSSGWPVLVVDAALMLLSSLLFTAFSSANSRGHEPRVAMLWSATLVLAIGFSSSLPCAWTLPAEANVQLTPVRLLAINLAGSAGEMAVPFLLGVAFERSHYGALGCGVAGLNIAILAVTLGAWLVVR